MQGLDTASQITILPFVNAASFVCIKYSLRGAPNGTYAYAQATMQEGHEEKVGDGCSRVLAFGSNERCKD